MDIFKEIDLPGFHYDSEGKIFFELTEDENREIKYMFDMFKSDEGYAVIKNEVAEKFHQGITAEGLLSYAEKELILAKTVADKKRALASVIKAFTIYRLPIYAFKIAKIAEPINCEVAKNFYKIFIEEEKNFKPDQMDGLFLKHYHNYQREELLKSAESKIKKLVL